MSIGEIGELVVCLLQNEEGMSQFSKISDWNYGLDGIFSVLGYLHSKFY